MTADDLSWVASWPPRGFVLLKHYTMRAPRPTRAGTPSLLAERLAHYGGALVKHPISLVSHKNRTAWFILFASVLLSFCPSFLQCFHTNQPTNQQQRQRLSANVRHPTWELGKPEMWDGPNGT